MSHIKTQIGKVRFNPVEEQFEALVTLHLPDGPARIAASFAAPITADFEFVARGLWASAMDGIKRSDTLRSQILAPQPYLATPEAVLPRAA